MVYLASAHECAPSPSTAVAEADLEQLGDEIAELAAHLHAATYRLLVCLREFDARDGWRGGFRSCAHWLSWRTGIALGAAREKVRVARALERLPLLSEAMRRGELSFAKVRAATRVATAENEERLLELACHGTASQVEKVVRAWRRTDLVAERAEERERHQNRELTLFADDDGMYVLRARLDPEAGALLERALAAAMEVLYGRTGAPGGGAADAAAGLEAATVEQRRADAIGLVAECALQGGKSTDVSPNGEQGRFGTVSRAERFEVVVHVDADALRASSAAGQSVLAGGVHVSAETSRRLACDAGRVVMTHGSDGSVLDVGRRSRVVPAAIRRALAHRDRGCRFPGCGLRHCDAHHVRHWADGGETRLDNVVLLCRRHHRAVHEDGYRVELASDGGVRFHRPDGRIIPHAPAARPLPTDPVAALAAAHKNARLAIGPGTTEPCQTGDCLDLDFAVLTLRGLCRRG